MIPDFYKVKVVGEAFLATMPRPRGDDWLEDEMKGLGCCGIRTLVSMLETHEIMELGLGQIEQQASRFDIAYLSLPAPDRGVPRDIRGFVDLAIDLAKRLRSGSSVAVHCRGGIGRSTLLAAATMVSLGDDPASVFGTISKARGLEVPDTDEQAEWFLSNASRFQTSR